MKARELIELLESHDPELEVKISLNYLDKEKCDCMVATPVALDVAHIKVRFSLSDRPAFVEIHKGQEQPDDTYEQVLMLHPNSHDWRE